jgi:hypothetical protein
LTVRSGRPIYVIVLFALSSIYMGVFFLPALYSLLFPNPDIQRFVAALKDGGTAPLDADTVVEQAKAALGPLTKAIQVGWGYNASKQYHLAGAHEQATITTTSYFYLAWFERLPKPIVISVALYKNDSGQKAYRIDRISGVLLARQGAIPLLLFGVSLFLMLRTPRPTRTGSIRNHPNLSVDCR